MTSNVILFSEKLRKNLINIMILATVPVLTSCSFAPKTVDLSPDYPVPESYTEQSDLMSPHTLLSSKWWESFNNHELNTLIDSVVCRNLDLKLALSRVNQVESVFKQARSQQLPAVSLEGSGSTMDGSFYMAGNPIPVDETTYSASIGMNWELDIWGRVRNLKNAAVSDLKSSQSNLRSLYQGLVAQTALLYFDIQSMERRLDLTDRMEITYLEDLELQKERYRNGIGSRLAVAQAEQALAATSLQKVQEEQQLSNSKFALNILLGQYPGAELSIEADTYIDIASLELIPVGIPSELLVQRPDIASAEASIEAARHRVGAARADMLPRIALSGSSSYNNSSVDNLFDDKSQLTTFAGAGSWIFTFGARKAAVRQNQEIYQQAIITYQQTVLNAFKEVESALLISDNGYQQYELLRQQSSAADDILRLQNDRYFQGIGEYDRLLDARLGSFMAHANLINAEKNIIQSRINLYLALGGDWK